MKILSTDWEIVDFADAWAIALEYSARHMHPGALEEAQGPAVAHMACADGVVSVRLRPGAGGRMQAFVLMAVGTSFEGAFRRQEPAMLAIARDMGAETLAFRSPRRGWIRLVGPEWARTGDLYEREVPR